MREKLAALGAKKSFHKAVLIFDLCYILFLLIVYRPSVRNFILGCIPWLVQYELLWPKLSALGKQDNKDYDRYWKWSWIALIVYGILLTLVTDRILVLPKDLARRIDFSLFLGVIPLLNMVGLVRFYKPAPPDGALPSEKGTPD